MINIKINNNNNLFSRRIINPLTFTAVLNNSAVQLIKVGDPWLVNLQYKINNLYWKNYLINNIILLSNNDKVLFKSTTNKFSKYRGANNDPTTQPLSGDFYQFVMSGKINGTGNTNSLINYSSITLHCFSNLFRNCSSLIIPPLLPAKILLDNCYDGTFIGCTNLIETVPFNENTALAFQCYRWMYGYCYSLTEVPDLPNKILADNCYEGMFSVCLGFTKIDKQLPATTLAPYCYYGMFQLCYNISSVIPNLLLASTLADYCYYRMFCNCINLTAPPLLSTTTLANYCYYYMFLNCTNLSTAPSLPATNLAGWCYLAMFAYCTKLIIPPLLPATTLSYSCYLGMFIGCSSLSAAPDLNALHIPDYSYGAMFLGCSSLIKAPKMLATTLSYWSCYKMFWNCTNLSSININFTNWNAKNLSTINWLYNVSNNGTFTCKSLLGTNDTILRGNNYCPLNWSVINK